MRSRLVAATSRTSTLCVRPLPKRSNSCSCNTRSNFRLQRRGDVAHFVEKQRAFISHFEAPDLLGNRTGKGTLLVTEEFAFQKIQRNGRAIELYESAPDALTGVMNGMRDEFLSRAGFPLDEDSRVGCGHDPNHVEYAP